MSLIITRTFTRREIPFKAVQLTEENMEEVLEWVKTYEHASITGYGSGKVLLMHNGPAWAHPGDWIAEWDERPTHLTIWREDIFAEKMREL